MKCLVLLPEKVVLRHFEAQYSAICHNVNASVLSLYCHVDVTVPSLSLCAGGDAGRLEPTLPVGCPCTLERPQSAAGEEGAHGGP